MTNPKDCYPVYSAVLVSCGDHNIISIGMCTGVSFAPPLIAISVGKTRYSHDLIRKAGDFVVGIPVKGMQDAIRACGSVSGKDCNKFEHAKLTAKKAKKVSAKLISECPVNLECKVISEADAGDHTIFIGEVVEAHKKEGFDTKDSLAYKGGIFYELKPSS